MRIKAEAELLQVDGLTEIDDDLKRREVEALERIADNMTSQSHKPNLKSGFFGARVCGSWPHCYHGMAAGGIFGCYGKR